MKFSPYNTSGFTLVELMIGILIFSISMTSIYVLIQTAITSSAQVRHEIIAANLLREQIEVIKNMRDTNVRNFIPWDSAFIGRSSTERFASGYYIVENDFGPNSSTVSIDPNTGNFIKSPVRMDRVFPSGIPGDTFTRYTVTRLFIDDYGRYTHDSTSRESPYASYISIAPLDIPLIPPLKVGYVDTSISPSVFRPQAYKITAHVISSVPSFRDYELTALITDWKK